LKRREQEAGDDLFVGGKLAARRQKAGITIEKAAKDTRIPVEKLLQIEADDLSGFAHPTYARMFLVDYANYLRVPLDEIRTNLPGSQKLGSGDNKYLDVLLATPGFLHGEQFKSLRRLLIVQPVHEPVLVGQRKHLAQLGVAKRLLKAWPRAPVVQLALELLDAKDAADG
jgi:transcriptional regulator with XRE-family HTH domain